MFFQHRCTPLKTGETTKLKKLHLENEAGYREVETRWDVSTCTTCLADYHHNPRRVEGGVEIVTSYQDSIEAKNKIKRNIMIIFAVLLGLSTLVLSTNSDNMTTSQPKTSKELYLERGGAVR